MALPRGAMGLLRFVIVVFSDHTHLLFLTMNFECCFRSQLLILSGLTAVLTVRECKVVVFYSVCSCVY